MTKSKNPSGRVNDPKARAEAAMASSSTQPEDTTMPIFFYMPNEHPYGIFCQWQKSYFTVPKSSFRYLDRDTAIGKPARSTEGTTSSTLASTTNAEFSKSAQKEETITFNCAEQYMMYCKAVYFSDPSAAAKILASKDSKIQKQLGRQVRSYNDHDWSLVRATVGKKGNYAKFTQDVRLGKVLIGTGERLLCEAARHDDIWGIGMDEATGIATWNAMGEEAQKHWGLNLLGKSIMAVRTRIREEEGDQKEGSQEEGGERKGGQKEGEKEKEESTQVEKVRGLNKKLRDIKALKMRRDAGEKLEVTQLKKIESEEAVRKELTELGESGERAATDSTERWGMLGFVLEPPHSAME